MIANGLTKPLQGAQFKLFADQILGGVVIGCVEILSGQKRHRRRTLNAIRAALDPAVGDGASPNISRPVLHAAIGDEPLCPRHPAFVTEQIIQVVDRMDVPRGLYCALFTGHTTSMYRSILHPTYDTYILDSSRRISPAAGSILCSSYTSSYSFTHRTHRSFLH